MVIVPLRADGLPSHLTTLYQQQSEQSKVTVRREVDSFDSLTMWKSNAWIRRHIQSELVDPNLLISIDGIRIRRLFAVLKFQVIRANMEKMAFYSRKTSCRAQRNTNNGVSIRRPDGDRHSVQRWWVNNGRPPQITLMRVLGSCESRRSCF